MIYAKTHNAVHRAIAQAPNFTPWEFRCRCGICNQIVLDLRLPERLQKMRDLAGRPIHIASGYRCARYNDKLLQEGQPAAKASKHIVGLAADIAMRNDQGELFHGQDIARLAYLVGFRGIGVAETWCHVDLRESKRLALWTYGDGLDLKWLRQYIEAAI